MDKKNNQNDNPNKKKNIKSAIILLVVCLGITALFTSVMSRYKNGSQKKISYSKFLTMLDKGEIKKVQVADRKIYIEPKTQQNPLMKTTYYTVSMNDALLVNRLKEAEDNNKISSYEQQDINRNIILNDIAVYARAMKPKGRMFLSGFYVDDIDMIVNAARALGLCLTSVIANKNWANICFTRIENMDFTE